MCLSCKFKVLEFSFPSCYILLYKWWFIHSSDTWKNIISNVDQCGMNLSFPWWDNTTGNGLSVTLKSLGQLGKWNKFFVCFFFSQNKCAVEKAFTSVRKRNLCLPFWNFPDGGTTSSVIPHRFLVFFYEFRRKFKKS